jgi:hypothetical protein
MSVGPDDKKRDPVDAQLVGCGGRKGEVSVCR